MSEESQRCRGMRDLLPADMARFRRVEAAFRDVCLARGYREVRTPTIEHLHLFTATGTLSPHMLGRVYSFLDWDGWSGERVVLRPDATIGAARLFVEHMRGERLAKLFYIQNVFRFAAGDEPREGWQCGVELLGDTQPCGDVELILLGCQVLERLGLVPVEVRLSHPGVVRAVLAQAGLEPAEQVRTYDRILDGDPSVVSELEARLPDLGASLRLLLEGEGSGSAYLANVRSTFAGAVPVLASPLGELSVVVEALAALGVRCQVTTAAVGSFEYYTGPVFQFAANGEAVGSGGRYDGLIALVGGPSLPASGFALDADKLVSLLPSQDEAAMPGEAVIVRPTSQRPAVLAAAFAAADVLRRLGLWTEVALAADQPLTYRWRVTVRPKGEGVTFALYDGSTRRRRFFADLDGLVAALGVMADAP
jgi:histidyl-tRNA synthetase